MKNQPGTMKIQPGTIKTDLEPRITLKTPWKNEKPTWNL